MNKIIFSLPGAISDESKKKIESKGYVIIEVKDFNSIKQSFDLESLDPSEIFEIAVKHVGGNISDFGIEVRNRLYNKLRNSSSKATS